MGEVIRQVPFAVTLASYCIEFHERNLCSKCTPEGCPRLDNAALVIDKFRTQRMEKLRLNRRSI
ncbi:hypothetical protein [Micromonospora mirobrigensis]|uniref:Uncharacterized protein n=1 Tax=Micromonospora mirobrigensis TaxID=262898 RepID=A0A1C4XE01_9ACTN|nr:hypothetical protein [Micromonospora mirobrigensis]SCF06706.1 hypothetical protein GA0070564_10324 [Micromonospora mirobrigensis]